MGPSATMLGQRGPRMRQGTHQSRLTRSAAAGWNRGQPMRSRPTNQTPHQHKSDYTWERSRSAVFQASRVSAWRRSRRAGECARRRAAPVAAAPSLPTRTNRSGNTGWALRPCRQQVMVSGAAWARGCVAAGRPGVVACVRVAGRAGPGWAEPSDIRQPATREAALLRAAPLPPSNAPAKRRPARLRARGGVLARTWVAQTKHAHTHKRTHRHTGRDTRGARGAGGKSAPGLRADGASSGAGRATHALGGASKAAAGRGAPARGRAPRGRGRGRGSARAARGARARALYVPGRWGDRSGEASSRRRARPARAARCGAAWGLWPFGFPWVAVALAAAGRRAPRNGAAPAAHACSGKRAQTHRQCRLSSGVPRAAARGGRAGAGGGRNADGSQARAARPGPQRARACRGGAAEGI